MTEWRLFPDGHPPVHTTPGWYADRVRAPHLEEPGQRERLLHTAGHTLCLLSQPGISNLVDLGCGDGGLLSLLPATIPAWGYDLSFAAVTGARSDRQVDATYLDVVAGEPKWADLAVAGEMLEHLADPHAFVRRIAQHSRALVASSPAFETSTDHYEYHTWAWDTGGYRTLIEQAGFHVIRHDLIQSFQVVSAVRP